jgi:hypothetical protein
MGGIRHFHHNHHAFLHNNLIYFAFYLSPDLELYGHPRGKRLEFDPVNACWTFARKGIAEIRFEAISNKHEANVPARLEPLQIVAACRLAWRSALISDFEPDPSRAAESP